MKYILQCACSTGVVVPLLGYSAVAYSQEVKGSDRFLTASQETVQDASVSQDRQGISEIIVTAQRRQESVQRASLSIAAIGADELADRGVVDSQSLNGVVPGLKISYSGNSVQTYVRGVGDTTGNQLTQPSVSLNMDGVNLARSAAFGPVFFEALLHNA